MGILGCIQVLILSSCTFTLVPLLHDLNAFRLLDDWRMNRITIYTATLCRRWQKCVHQVLQSASGICQAQQNTKL